MENIFIKFFNRVQAFTTAPTKAFEKETKTSLNEAVLYGLKGLAFKGILAVLATLLWKIASGSLTGISGLTAALVMFLAVTLGGFTLYLVIGVWYHLWAYLLGAKKGISHTIKTIFFAATPDYVVGWIPYFNVVSSAWTFILIGVGLITSYTKTQSLPLGRAVSAFLLALMIPVVLAYVIMLVLASTMTELASNGLWG